MGDYFVDDYFRQNFDSSDAYAHNNDNLHKIKQMYCYTHDAKDKHSCGFTHLVRVRAIESVGERKSWTPDRCAYIVRGLHAPIVGLPTGIMAKYKIPTSVSAGASISLHVEYIYIHRSH